MTSEASSLSAYTAIARHLVDEQAFAWLAAEAQAIAGGQHRRQATAMALAPRHVGKQAASVPSELLLAVEELVPHADTSRWTVDQWARLYLLLHIPAADAPSLVKALDQLFRCADVAEALAMYQSLPFLPHPTAHLLRAREGMRSNQLPLVAAVALDNPYPMNFFDEDAWNQLILKCLFVALPLDRVQGVVQRANPRLSTMLVDYAKERHAASRPIPVDLWGAAKLSANPEQLAWMTANQHTV